MIKYPLKVVPIENEEDYSDIEDSNESRVADTIWNKTAETMVLRLNWLSEYSDAFLKEMGSLKHLITMNSNLNSILKQERDEAEERYQKLVDWEY